MESRSVAKETQHLGAAGQPHMLPEAGLPRTEPDGLRGLTFALLRARETVVRRFRPVFHRQNITEQQSRVLRTLARTSNIEITELADATCLLPPSISRILRDLEARGLVQRRISPTDLRRNLISLTPEGQQMVDASAEEIAAIFDSILLEFGPERLKTLCNLLVDLETSLGVTDADTDAEDAVLDS